MTKQGNFTQRTPQAKKQSDQASRQISKQASGSANAPYDLVFTAMGPPLGTTQTTATITSTEGLQRATFTTPPQTVPGTNTTEPPPPPLRHKGPELGANNLTLEGVATELAPSDFVSQNYETLVALMQEETKKRSSQSLQARLNFGPEDEVSPPRHQKERRGKDNRRPPVFGRIGKKVSGTQTANLQNLDTHENNDRRISVRDRLGSRDVHSRLGQRRSPSESPPSSDSEDSRRKRRRRVSSSSEDSSDNEDAETGHWKSKNKYREDEDEDMSRPWRRQKVDAFTRRISDFSEDKKRRMPKRSILMDSKEFADELAHILSPPEYDRFYFDLEADPGEFTSVLEKDLIDLSTKDFTSTELNNSPLLLYDCDSSLSKEFSEIDLQVSFPSGNEDISDPLFLIDSPEIDTLTSFPSGNEDKIFNSRILTSKVFPSRNYLGLSHRDSEAFKINKKINSPMEIFPLFLLYYGGDISFLDVPYLYFYPPMNKSIQGRVKLVTRIALDYEDSRAHGFVHCSLDLKSLACFYMGIRYPRSY
ncbi:hypothetical protein Tco_0609500 [Tanacetum coccineum]